MKSAWLSLFIIALALQAPAKAEDGYRLWLRYDSLPKEMQRIETIETKGFPMKRRYIYLLATTLAATITLAFLAGCSSGKRDGAAERLVFVKAVSPHLPFGNPADYAAIAGLLDLPEKNAHDQGEAVAAVKRWLENNSNWLLILDNADKIEIVDEFIPSCEAGHVLLTTRAHAMGAIGGSNKLEKMSPKEGALFLLRRLRKLKKEKALESATAEIRAQAEALSTLVDGLPLALDQAAAFIEEKPSTFEEYQTLYQTERKELLRRRGKLAKDHPSVTVTFSLAFQKVADDDPAAADLLRVCAFLEADSISEEIFSKGAKELGEALSSMAGSPLGLSDAIEEPLAFHCSGVIRRLER